VPKVVAQIQTVDYKIISTTFKHCMSFYFNDGENEPENE
jgi:hypothetical protein